MHIRQLAEHGGGSGVRDPGLLVSALKYPLNKFADESPDLAELAAAYAFGIARNHPFVAGNTRTALVASFTFLYVNGFKMTTSQQLNARQFIDLASGEFDEPALAMWFRNHTSRIRVHRTGGA